MHLQLNLLALCLTLTCICAQTSTTVDGCPKMNYACLDVINSSQCIEQLVIEKDAPLTKEAMEKCVTTEGSASNLTGAQKYCQCPGCHSAPINAAIAQLFPPPCV